MAISRTYLAAHWVTDTVSGVCIGTGLALVWPAALEMARERHARNRSPRRAQNVAARRRRSMMKSSRYRHPGDAIHLICCVLLLVAALAVVIAAADRLLGPSATFVTGVAPSTAAGRLLVGLVQVVTVVAALAAIVAVLGRRRYRLFVSLVGAAVLAGGLTWWFDHAARSIATNRVHEQPPPRRVVVRRGRPRPDIARRCGRCHGDGHQVADHGMATGIVDRLGRRGRGEARLRHDPAGAGGRRFRDRCNGRHCAAGRSGRPDRRPGPADVLAALQAGGFPAVSVELAPVTGRGSRHFVMSLAGGERRFVKVLGQDQRDADLLTAPTGTPGCATSVTRGPQPPSSKRWSTRRLVGIMAERAGVATPRVEGVVAGADGSAMLVIDSSRVSAWATWSRSR